MEEGNKMEDSMAGVDGAKGKKLDGKSQGDGKARPHRASALTLESHRRALTLSSPFDQDFSLKALLIKSQGF